MVAVGDRVVGHTSTLGDLHGVVTSIAGYVVTIAVDERHGVVGVTFVTGVNNVRLEEPGEEPKRIQ